MDIRTPLSFTIHYLSGGHTSASEISTAVFFLSIEVNFIYTKGITFSLSLFYTDMLYLYTVTVNVCRF